MRRPASLAQLLSSAFEELQSSRDLGLAQVVGRVRPFWIKRHLRFTRPLVMAVLVRLLAWFSRWRVFFTHAPKASRM
jgi:hypothetical protein